MSLAIIDILDILKSHVILEYYHDAQLAFADHTPYLVVGFQGIPSVTKMERHEPRDMSTRLMSAKSLPTYTAVHISVHPP
jgi:hypothetical protein